MTPVSLVLLPGMDGTGDLFQPLLAVIGNSIPTVVVRYPGDEPLDYAALTRLVREALPVDRPFVILGESFSGPIAVSIAAEAPRGMVGFILCASLLTRSGAWLRAFSFLLRFVPLRTAARQFGARRLMGRGETPELRDLLLKSLRQVSPHVLRARVRSALRTDVSLELAAAKLPSLYLQATEDRVASQAEARTFARQAFRGSVVTIAGPHLLLQCAPHEAARAIAQFMDTLPTPSASP